MKPGPSLKGSSRRGSLELASIWKPLMRCLTTNPLLTIAVTYPVRVRGRRVRDCDTGGPSIDQDGAEVKGRDAIQKLLGDNFISVDNGRY